MGIGWPSTRAATSGSGFGRRRHAVDLRRGPRIRAGRGRGGRGRRGRRRARRLLRPSTTLRPRDSATTTMRRRFMGRNLRGPPPRSQGSRRPGLASAHVLGAHALGPDREPAGLPGRGAAGAPGGPSSTSPSRTPRWPASPTRTTCWRRCPSRRPCATSPSPFGLRAAREAVAADYARRGVAVPRPHRAHRQQQRGLRLPLQAALRSRRHGARPPSELSAVRVPGRPRVGRGAALSAPLRRRVAPGPAPRLPGRPTPGTRAVVVVNPNNPTGSYVKREEARAHPADLPRKRGRR